MNTSIKIAITCAMLTVVNSALADPPPGNPKLPAPNGVFCIQPTLMQDIGGGDTRIVFEMVNWTPDFAVTLDLGLLLGGNQTSAGITVVGAGFVGSNDWTISSVPNSTSADYSVGSGTPISFIDLSAPFMNPFAPGPPDSGPNVLDGFELIINGWGPSERLSFDWTMGLLSTAPDLDGFDKGNWTIDRGSAPYSPGNLVLATTWEQPLPTPTNGFSPIDFANNPLDPVATDQNATTFGVPEPSCGLLLIVGSLLLGSQRRWC